MACSYGRDLLRVMQAKTDGLSDLVYSLVNTTKHSMHTKFYIDIRRIAMKRITLYIDGRPTMDVDISPGNGAVKSIMFYLMEFVFGVSNQWLAVWGSASGAAVSGIQGRGASKE